MKKIKVCEDVYGVTALDGVPMVSSRKVAEIFDKRHDHVMRDIDSIINDLLKPGETGNRLGLPKFGEANRKDFADINFKKSFYKDSQGKRYREYLLTRDGFTLVAMGFTGKKALEFKITYINRFNEMERFIISRSLARLEYPELTDMIKLMHDEPKFYHFSNEADMINRIVMGMPAKEIRQMHGLAKGESIRDHATPWQADMIQRLQKADVGFVVAIPDFKQRKKALENYFEKIKDFVVPVFERRNLAVLPGKIVGKEVANG